MLTKFLWLIVATAVAFVVLVVPISEKVDESLDDPAELGASAPTPAPSPEPTPTPVLEPTPTPTPEPLASVTLAFSGDLLSHGGVIEQARQYGLETELDYDFRPMFASVSPILSAADLAICHQETPLSADNTGLSGYPIFNAPGQLADAIAATGWDGCSVASNHSIDKGFGGVTQTLDELDRVNVGHSGMARTQDERDAPPIYEIDGMAVGHLSYTYGTNGIPLPSDAPFAVNITTIEAVLADAAAVKDAGADFVVLSLQWGNEYQQNPSGIQVDQATAFTASPDIDLIIGDHVHVPQPVQVVNGKLVLYGLGNFVSNQSPQSCNSCPAASQDGMIFTVTVEETDSGEFEVTAAHVTPTFVDRSVYEVIPVAQRLADPTAAGILTEALMASWERTNQAIYSLDVDPDFVTFEALPGQ